MVRAEKLYRKARESRGRNIHFHDLCSLAEAAGFRFDRQRGAHRIYKHDDLDVILNFQENRGEAVPYQVRQLLDLIDEHRLLG